MIKNKFKKQNEIKENVSKILFGLENENFEVKENLRTCLKSFLTNFWLN